MKSKTVQRRENCFSSQFKFVSDSVFTKYEQSFPFWLPFCYQISPWAVGCGVLGPRLVIKVIPFAEPNPLPFPAPSPTATATESMYEAGNPNVGAVTGTQTTAGGKQIFTLDLSRAAVSGGSLAQHRSEIFSENSTKDSHCRPAGKAQWLSGDL